MTSNVMKLIKQYYKTIKFAPKDKYMKYENELLKNLAQKNILYSPLSEIHNTSEIKGLENYLNFRIPFYQLILKLKNDEIDSVCEKIDKLEISENLTLSTIINKVKNEFIEKEPSDKKEIEDKKPEKSEEEQMFEEKNPFEDSGYYHLNKGKMVKGKYEKRQTTLFSNWNASNCDPDDLKKHKELLDRQHFKGPFWDGKTIPKSVEEVVPQYNHVPGDFDKDDPVNIEKIRTNQKEFKLVKR